MFWLRQTLKQSRVLVQSLLLVGLFHPTDRISYVYADELNRGIEQAGTAPVPPGGALPLRRLEQKARTLAGTVSATPAGSSAFALASAPRRVIPKSVQEPEIVALAESLGNSPGRIFRFVHDTIDFDPKWGATKSPLGTLHEGWGTSWDQAWLLQQLLSAAGVDARFEWGEVEIEPELLIELAGVEDPFRAGDLLTTAGVPIVLITSGSQVVAARMSHVWVKAHLDYTPNRGATPGPGDTWIRMDPSLERFALAGGHRLDEQVPFALGEYLRSGTPFPPRLVYEEALLAYVADNGLGAAGLEEVKRSKTLIAEDFPFVPGTLRGKILSVGGESPEVPAAFQQQLELQVRAAGGQTLLTWSTPWPAVYGRSLELAWPGATSADQATLDLNGGVFATPPFEVDLKPSIRVDGAEAAAGEAIGSAEAALLVATLTSPEGSSIVAQFDLFAGEHAVLAVDFGRMPQEVVDRYALAGDGASDPSEEEAWDLAQVAARYLQSLAGDLEHLTALRWRRLVQLGNVVLAVRRGGVSRAADGTPLTFSPAPPAIDLGSMVLGLFAPDGAAASPASAVSTLELLGSQASFLESEALTEVLGGEHISAVGFLTRAAREGQTLTRVDASNLNAALAAAELSAEAEASVRAGVERGLIAWISETQLPVESWDATGYVLEDPSTGGGAYLVTFERLVPGLEIDATFHGPQDLDVVTAPIDVVASLDGDEVESWTLSYRAADGGPAIQLAAGTGPFANATLASFDPTLLLNGLYHLVLTARDGVGQSASEQISISVEGYMKAGNFTLSFVDLVVPLSGLDIEIGRTYDSRDKRPGDFGVGWALDLGHGSYRNSRTPGDGWRFVTGVLPCETAVETKTHLTTIRLSDHEIYRFRLLLSDIAILLGGCTAEASFAYVAGPRPGATLEILGNRRVLYQGGDDRLLDANTFAVYEPDAVRLTTRDGRIFDLSLTTGVFRMEDLNGNSLDFTPTAITHSSGTAIELERDADGRITRIVDLAGRAVSYQQDAAGDLVAVVDRAGNTSSFGYDARHNMLEMTNPDGIQPVRNEYDEDGRLIRHTDPLGKPLEFQHDLDTFTQTVVDRLGQTTILEFDDRGRIVSETDPTGRVTRRSFDDRDNVLSMTGPQGLNRSFTYSAANDLTSIIDPLGNTTSYTYDSRGRELTITDPRGATRTNTYDSRGNLTSVEDALGNLTSWTLDERGRRLTEINPLGDVRSWAYDTRGNLILETDFLGHETVHTYDASGNRLSSSETRTTPGGGSETLTTTRGYDARDRLLSTTTPDGAVSSTVYNTIGKAVQQIDPLGRVTSLSYDAAGRLVRTEHPDGTSTIRSYDDEGRLVATTDRAGRTTTMTYDAAGRLLATMHPDGTRVSTVYDEAGEVISSIDELGRVTSFTYDAAGRRTEVTDALGNLTSFTFDANGNILTSTDPLGNVTAHGYDALDRRLTTTFADDAIRQVAYDPLGRQIEEVDPSGRVTRFAFDALNRLTAVTDPLGQTTTYSYDEAGNRVSQTDANGNTTLFEHDAAGRLLARQYPDGARETLAYFADGKLASRTDFNGATTTFAYDSNQRLINRRHADGSEVSFSYTPTGRRASVTDARGTTTYAYDLRDRLILKTEPDGRALSYAWDAAGNRTGLTASLNGPSFSSSYAYDPLDRQVAVTDSSGATYASSYDANSNRTSLSFPNGVTTATSFDSTDRLIALDTRTAAGDVLQSYAYTLAPTGHRLRIAEHDGTTHDYSYDASYRLIEERVAGGDAALLYRRSFVYDPVGNRLRREEEAADGSVSSLAYVYDSRDRLLSAGSTAYAWDSNGNLLSRTGADSRDYVWDFEDRLIRVDRADGSEVRTTYDADGNRVRTEVVVAGGASAVTDYLVDTEGALSHVVAETDASGAVLAHYVRSAVRLLAVERPGSMTRYFHTDGLDSVRRLSDAAANVTDTFSFTAFGEARERTGSDPNPYRFAGEPVDPDAGLTYNRARWLDTGTGRFVSSDPFPGIAASPLTLHRFLYGLADPVNLIDPSGELASAEKVSITSSVFLQVARALKLLKPGFHNTRPLIIGFDGAGSPSKPGNEPFHELVKEHKGFPLNGGFIHNNDAIAVKALKQALEFRRQHPKGRVITMGYSRGGNTALRYVDFLARIRIPPWSVITFDPHAFRKHLQVSRSLPLSLNFYQQNPTNFIKKFFVPVERTNSFNGVPVVGVRFEVEYLDPTVTHGTIINVSKDRFRHEINSALE